MMQASAEYLLTWWQPELRSFIVDPWHRWLAHHPLVAWLVQHPFWSLGLGIVSLVLVSGLLGAISRLTERLWLTLMSLPMRTLLWMLSGALSAFHGRRGRNSPNTANRIAEIMARLSTLQSEQTSLLRELHELVGDEKLTSSTGPAKASRPESKPKSSLESPSKVQPKAQLES